MVQAAERDVKAHFDAMHAMRAQLRELGFQPEKDLKDFWHQNITPILGQTHVVLNLRKVLNDFGAEVPASFPQGTIQEILDTCLSSSLDFRLQVLFFRVAASFTDLSDTGPDAIATQKIDDIFTPPALLALRDSLLRCVDGDFTSGKTLNWSTQEVREAIEEVLR